MAGQHLSKDFFDLVKSIGDAKSKQVRRRLRTSVTSILLLTRLSTSDDVCRKKTVSSFKKQRFSKKLSLIKHLQASV